MGYCLPEDRGIFSTEARRESFVIHFETYAPPPEYWFVQGHPHPEFVWADLDDLRSALDDLKAYAVERNIKTSRDEPLITPGRREQILDTGTLEAGIPGPH